MPTPQEPFYPENLEPKTKICTRKGCPSNGSSQTLDKFFVRKDRECGYTSWCKVCYRLNRKNPIKTPRNTRPAPEGFKICNRPTCAHKGATQPVSNFCKDCVKHDGLNGTCKDCTKEDAERRKQVNKSSPSPYVEGRMKVCTKSDCIHQGVEQPVTNFYRHSNQKGGLACECKDCTDKASREYRKDNPEKVKECIKKWMIENKEYLKQYHHDNHIATDRKYRIDHWADMKVDEAQKRAEKKKIPFNLEASDLHPLPKFCSVFGMELDYQCGKDRRVWASVDRIVPKFGYVKGNVRVISLAANMAKFDGIGDILPLRKPKRDVNETDQPSLFDKE